MKNVSFTIYNEATGRVVRYGTCPENQLGVQAQPGERLLEVEGSFDQYVDNDILIPVPVRPSDCHDWNWQMKTWEANLQKARDKTLSLLDPERHRRNQLPIIYDGKLLGAKELPDQKNLSDKKSGVQERLRLGVGMDPDDMVWKDEDNIVHQWVDLQAYYDWLSGYVIALEDRGTKLYRAMWQHKENINALTNIEDILAYDVTQGW